MDGLEKREDYAGTIKRKEENHALYGTGWCVCGKYFSCGIYDADLYGNV